jgi:hypothetical protein
MTADLTGETSMPDQLPLPHPVRARPHRPRRFTPWVFGAIALTAALAPEAADAADCPESCIYDVRRGHSCYTTATAESSYFGQGLQDCGFTGSYDLRTGSLHGQVSCGFNSDGVRVLVADDFTLAGSTGSDPIAFEAELSMHAVGTYQRGSLQVSITEGTQSTSESFPIPFTGTAITVLHLPLSHVPGEVFRVEFMLQADSGGESGTDASATYRFNGLPPGVLVTSCQGFVGDTQTPVRRQTWGALKAIYR